MWASMGPRPRGRGNFIDESKLPVKRGASMGPRPRGRGNVALSRRDPRTQFASMGPRPRGRGNGSLPGLRLKSNQASMGPRPRGRGNAAVTGRLIPISVGLQWGRDRAVAEMTRTEARQAADFIASMGPRPRGRGNLRLSLGSKNPPTGFNGAATARSRKCAEWHSAFVVTGRLQWGRDRAVAEIGARCRT